ncbi:MAG: hypothetical protein SAK29_20790 [Scytonema sp. PMC 1069.18]|nr:hypothetical protein [Scytonema sp. PMC 1069.18]MEC4886843.1 hypothetical protein [Scytonema sp. PMC 1070.18]
MLKIGKPTIVITSLTLVVLGTLPAVALGNVWSDFQEYVRDLRDYVTNNTENFRPYEAQAQSAITNASDNDTLFNPIAAADSVQEQIVSYSLSDRFENNPSVYGNTLGSEISRYITRGAAQGLLGREGQLRLKSTLEETQKAVEDNDRIANEASREAQQAQGLKSQCSANFNTNGVNMSQRVSCELLALSVNLQSQSLKLQAEQSKLMAENVGNTIKLRNDLQYSNLNLANISQQMDETNRARRVDTSAEVARLLRVTSQTDLFRKSNRSAPSSLEELGDSTEQEREDFSIEPPTEESQ